MNSGIAGEPQTAGQIGCRRHDENARPKYARRSAAPAVDAGNAVNRKAAKPKEYKVVPPNNGALLKTASDKVVGNGSGGGSEGEFEDEPGGAAATGAHGCDR